MGISVSVGVKMDVSMSLSLSGNETASVGVCSGVYAAGNNQGLHTCPRAGPDAPLQAVLGSAGYGLHGGISLPLQCYLCIHNNNNYNIHAFQHKLGACNDSLCLPRTCALPDPFVTTEQHS